VLHDYGMGGLWWWITAESAAQVAHLLSEAEVITDDEVVRDAEGWELDTTGRRLRQVELRPDGDPVATDDWPFNPPFDLYDPRYAAMEISRAEFEEAWRRGGGRSA
jgi:hypothetical protein